MKLKMAFASVALSVSSLAGAAPQVDPSEFKKPECVSARLAYATEVARHVSLGLIPQQKGTEAEEKAAKDGLPRSEAAAFGACGVKPRDAVRIERQSFKK